MSARTLRPMLSLLLALLPAALLAQSPANPPAKPSAKPSARAAAPAAPAAGLDALLQEIRESSRDSARLNQEREARFLRNKATQQAELARAEAAQAQAEARAAQARSRFDAAQAEIARLREQLTARIGESGQVYSAVKETAGQFHAEAAESLVTAQMPERLQTLNTLAEGREVPGISEIEALWFLLAEEIAEGGKVTRFSAEIDDAEGARREATVTRVGLFSAFTGGEYLTLQDDGRLAALARQPRAYQGLAEDFEAAGGELAPVLIDPSRGELLDLYTLKPTLGERIDQGGEVGYLIIVIGVLGTVLAVYQLVFLAAESRRVRRQLQDTRQPRPDNSLGRVLAVLKNETENDPEVLELHLSEAVLRETPRLERFQTLLRMIVAAGPLLGLLGTVVGMIITFQVITEQGAGDPRLMAGGISQAMVATVLGLGIAIPLLFINSILSSRSRVLTQILDEQCAGLLAERLEAARRGGAP
ncbi:MAG TPA: MotA/TolQ/ExbB proton channel family protein [Nevskiaceae bacterium]|nr:MotA/TolQ/ExbB proton channel family protein [Nevskiaceae bacterium]